MIFILGLGLLTKFIGLTVRILAMVLIIFTAFNTVFYRNSCDS